jgi:hypothetical protein
MDIITLFPHDILYNIFTFDTRFVLQNKKWIFIDKISKMDDRYLLLKKRIIITRIYRQNPSSETSSIVTKQHQNVFSIHIYNMSFVSDIEFSHYLYKTIQMYKYF